MKILLASSLLAATLAFSPSAHADFIASGSGGGFSGTGTLTTIDQGGGEYLITSMSGQGNPTLFAPGQFQNNDNLLFPDAGQYVDTQGFAFSIITGEDTDSVDISATGTSAAPAYQAYIVDEGGNLEVIPVTFNLSEDGSPDVAALFAPLTVGQTVDFSFTFTPAVNPAPEPSSLLLLATGLLAALAATARRSFRRA